LGPGQCQTVFIRENGLASLSVSEAEKNIPLDNVLRFILEIKNTFANP
jgi:hypothetical protein